MKVGIDLLGSVILPVVGYITMIEMKKRAERSIELKAFSEGIYCLKPVYGERALTLARSYARAGTMIFGFLAISSG